MTTDGFSCSLLFKSKNKEYGDKIFRNPDEGYIIKNINTFFLCTLLFKYRETKTCIVGYKLVNVINNCVRLQ